MYIHAAYVFVHTYIHTYRRAHTHANTRTRTHTHIHKAVIFLVDTFYYNKTYCLASGIHKN